MEINQELKDKIIAEIIKRIKNKGVDLKCPVCNHSEFELVDGFTRRDITKNYKHIQLGGQHIPSVSIVCKNCGNILDFAIGTLGFLKKEEDSKDDNPKD